jgi:hypothetical protein
MTEQRTDINELFSRDPLNLTDPDIDEIIAAMRERRHLFKAGPAKAPSAAKTLTNKQQVASKLKIELEL